MGNKVTVSDIENVESNSGVPIINQNTSRLADEFDNVLYRDGSQAATNDLDMDSNRLLNLPEPITLAEPLTRRSLDYAYGVANYRATRAEAINDFEVGEYFTSSETGSLRMYKRIDTAPYYADQGDDAAPVGLATFSATGGADLVGFIQSGSGAIARTLQDKARETVSVLDFGAVGDGVTNDTDAIDNALATGLHVIFPEGYTFLTRGLHQLITNYQRITINGTVKYDGVRRFIATGVYGFQGLFQVQDGVEGVTFDGVGIMDGNWDRGMDQVTGTGLKFRDAGSGIYAYRAKSLRVDGLTFTHFSENGIKALNCPDINVSRTCRFIDICNIGVEMYSYVNDPRTALPWVGDVFAPSGSVDGFYDLIDDGEFFGNYGNGVGVSFQSAPSALPVNNLRVSGHYRDCLASIWSENNSSEATNIVIDSPRIRGNFRGAGTASSLSGIGLIGVKNSQVISPVILNVGNVTPASGSESAGMHIVECDGISIVNPTIIDDTGAANRTQFGIRINAGTNILIRGGTVSGVSNTPIVKVNSPTNVRIENVKGAADDEAWGNVVMYGPFKSTALPASSNTYMLMNGETGMDDIWIPAPGRIVGCVARLSAAPAGGTIDIRPYSTSIEQTAAGIPNAAFAGGSRASSRCAPEETDQIAAGARIEVVVTTGGLSPAGSINALVWVLVDHGIKT